MKMRTRAGIAKVLGLVVCMAGVVTLTFYKGLRLKPFFNHHLLEYQSSQQHHQPQMLIIKINKGGFIFSIYGYNLLGLVACTSGTIL